jgi:hypothetical protein
VQGWLQRYLPAVGVLGGLFAGLFGVGSGIVAAPLLVRGFGKRQAVAQGIALVVPSAGGVADLCRRRPAWATGIPRRGRPVDHLPVALAHRL